MSDRIDRYISRHVNGSNDKLWNEYCIANNVGSQRLIQYLAATRESAWEIDGVKIHTRRVGNRTGVPATASTWMYELTGEGYTVHVRTVWHHGTLLTPIRTHTRVIKVTPDTADARRSYNRWLCSLSLL